MFPSTLLPSRDMCLGGLRDRWVPHFQGLQHWELCRREGKGICSAPSAVAWLSRLSATLRAPCTQGPWVVSAASRLATHLWSPIICLKYIGSLMLFSPAELCAGCWGLPLRVWVPAHNPSSGEVTPEPRPAGGEVWLRLEAECTGQVEGSLLRGRGDSPVACCCKPCWGGAECASSIAELQLRWEPWSGRVPCTRLLCLGRALPRLAWLLDFLPRKEQSARGWETPLAPSWPQLCSCLAFAPRPQAFLWWLRGRWLPHCQGLQQWELCSREMKGIFGMQSFIRCETHTFTLNPHPEPLPSPSPTPSPWTLTLTLTLKPYPHPHP